MKTINIKLLSYLNIFKNNIIINRFFFRIVKFLNYYSCNKKKFHLLFKSSVLNKLTNKHKKNLLSKYLKINKLLKLEILNIKFPKTKYEITQKKLMKYKKSKI